MAKLLDLPEELLSFICEETDAESLFPLAISCRVFNRLAGNRYLRHINYDRLSLDISDRGQSRPWNPQELSFSTLHNVARILGSLTNVSFISVIFSTHAPVALKQLKSIVLLLRRIQHGIRSIRVSFDRGLSGIGYHSKPCSVSLFNAAFKEFMQQVQRTRVKSLQIQGYVPLTKGRFGFRLSQNTYISDFQISDSFLLSDRCRGWLITFLNSSAIASLTASNSDGWTAILPKIQMPSLQRIVFSESWSIPRQGSKRVDIDVLADFLNRHPILYHVDCGNLSTPIPTPRSRQCPPLTSITQIKGTILQLCHFLSFSNVLPNLQRIEIDRQSSLNYALKKSELWGLLAFLRKRSTLRTLTIPINLYRLRSDILSGLKTPIRSMLPQVKSLEFLGFRDFPEQETLNFLRWGQKVFPNVGILNVRYVEWSDERNSSFAQAVYTEWSSVKTLKINSTCTYVKTENGAGEFRQQ
ncbi:hypothetical protein GYMLUDRAFT_264599 [Collybiopsis luxurians FD-317 M1]|uniref:F-box domain-containing protein n=1 Tax=Collybiopsis luxurians FD-317 M1 TaxID=944289 RepID=A0A0D0BXL9_9AGAR|nr:hypothetical protein GYMLUDRAFT_264599 [Collybiopsis luxurians FD-317 M1]